MLLVARPFPGMPDCNLMAWPTLLWSTVSHSYLSLLLSPLPHFTLPLPPPLPYPPFIPTLCYWLACDCLPQYLIHTIQRTRKGAWNVCVHHVYVCLTDTNKHTHTHTHTSLSLSIVGSPISPTSSYGPGSVPPHHQLGIYGEQNIHSTLC